MNNKERYLKLLSSCTIKEFSTYLRDNEDSIITVPSTLLIPPLTNKIILHDDIITTIFEFYKKNKVDLNSNSLFAERKDMLQGADFISGVLMFSVFYIVKFEKRALLSEEVNQLVRLAEKAAKYNWTVSNRFSSGLTIVDMLEESILDGNEELEPFYNSLCEMRKKEANNSSSTVVSIKTLNPQITESKKPVVNTIRKMVNVSNRIDKNDSLSRFLLAVAIDGYIDPSLFNNVSLMNAIENTIVENDIFSLDDYLQKLGLLSQLSSLTNEEDDEHIVSEDVHDSVKENVEEQQEIVTEIKNETHVNKSRVEEYLINEETSEDAYDLIRVINELVKLYENKNQEENSEFVFLKNPEYTNYYFALNENSEKLFGCSLNSLFIKLGIVKKSQIIQNDIIEKVVSSENEVETKIVINETKNKKDEIDAHRIEVIRFKRILDSIFVDKEINLSAIEGTTLYNKLNSFSDEYKFDDVQDLIGWLGYTINNESKEIYRVLLSRIYK